MVVVQAHIYVHHPEGEPTKVVPYSGRKVVIGSGPTNDIATSVEVLGFVAGGFYRAHREGRPPVSLFERVTSEQDRRELTDLLKVGRVESVYFEEGGTEEIDLSHPMIHSRLNGLR